MIEIIEVLRQEHRNIEKLLRVLERELGGSIAAITGLRGRPGGH